MSTLPTLTTDQAYQAMRAFLEAYWERGGRPDSQLTDLLSGMQGGAGETADPAMWADWLDAIGAVTGFRLPDL
ncbi:hypothetical protein FM111_00920 [Brevundimonas diminuta 3F5N]|uniref:Uncharacterized protein n=1 Tax=Brevundimonas diminuta 3F5N TaxID=1255603 RepID=A0A1R4EUU3_BREDI|nr:hypothetical protein [Brevundimonas diminuta]SJM47412.1 hypothetical protein FM111_00920 [Brevundimonas diminuta 3F5N]